jgi:hypothetical protein
MNIIHEFLQKEIVASQSDKNIIPVELIHPYFEWDVWSKEIMEKMGFKITRFCMSITKEKWLCVSVDWKLEDEKDRGYMVKYPKEGGRGFGQDDVHVEFFFSDIENDPESYRADYSDIEREYNGFGKVSFDVGIEIHEEEWPVLGYDYAYSQNTKYGVCVYFKPYNFGLTDRILVEYNEDLLKITDKNA